MDLNRPKPNGKALIPFLVFVIFYLGSGLILSAQGVEMAFYQIPSPVSIIIGIIVAFFMFSGTVTDKFETFLKGLGDYNILIMCLVYLLAGAFSSVSGASGGIDSVVNFGLTLIPVEYITAGLFIIACFISIASGTSVGTVVTVGPIAVGIAEKSGLSMFLIIGTLLSGAMFGDNLSVISDTTIAATRTQNVDMRDKFRMNFKIALPAAIVTFIILLIVGKPDEIVNMGDLEYEVLPILPYLFVLISAIAGMNVFLVLISGIVLAGLVGLYNGSFNLVEYTGLIYDGFLSVNEIFLLSLLTGGLAYMVREEGGIEWAIEKIRGLAKSERSAELSVGLLTLVADAAVANNTVAIIIIGPVAKEISNKYKVDPRRMASILDSFSCVMQGLIPYGAQVLMAAQATEGVVSPVSLMKYTWYPYILLVFFIISIIFRVGISKEPWDFEKNRV